MQMFNRPNCTVEASFHITGSSETVSTITSKCSHWVLSWASAVVFGYLPICRTAAEPCGWHQWWCRCCWPRASWPGGNISEALWKYVAVRVLINDSTAADVINYRLKGRPDHQTIFISVLMEAKQGEEEMLTYAQFPISFANIFSGMVLGSSFSFPSVIRLSVQRKNKWRRSALSLKDNLDIS